MASGRTSTRSFWTIITEHIKSGIWSLIHFMKLPSGYHDRVKAERENWVHCYKSELDVTYHPSWIISQLIRSKVIWPFVLYIRFLEDLEFLELTFVSQEVSLSKGPLPTWNPYPNLELAFFWTEKDWLFKSLSFLTSCPKFVHALTKLVE